jgi:hypothetical protein
MYKKLSTEESARCARDYAEIKTVYAAHAYCMGAQQQRYELDNYWAQEHEDLVYAIDNDAYAGRDKVYEFYAYATERAARTRLENLHRLFPDEVSLSDENLGMGDLCIRGSNTPYIEVSMDGRTARGIWQVIDLTSYLDEKGDPKPYLVIGRNLVEFVRESSGWRIWHFRILRDFQWKLDKDFILSKTKLFRTVGNSGTMVPANVKLRPFEMEGNYSTRRVPKFAPPLPQKTPTWDEERSFCYVVGRLDADPDCMPGGAYYVEPEDA